jgi:hypothetical protein
MLPPGIDRTGIEVITPRIRKQLWYSGENAGGDEENDGVTVRLAVEYKHPSVVLDHSGHIGGISCSSSSIKGSFSDATTASRSVSKWAGNPIIFITSAAACSADGSPLFFQCSLVKVSEDLSSFELSGSFVELSDVLETMDIDFGKFDPEPTTPSNETCGEPASAILSGLPALPCGVGFDKKLDDKLGYYSQQSPLIDVGIQLNHVWINL